MYLHLSRDMRNWIEEQNLKLIETEKEAKSSLNAAKEKVSIGNLMIIAAE